MHKSREDKERAGDVSQTDGGGLGSLTKGC